jgi:hypothetical protein
MVAAATTGGSSELLDDAGYLSDVQRAMRTGGYPAVGGQRGEHGRVVDRRRNGFKAIDH